jgi:hypothetical protein
MKKRPATVKGGAKGSFSAIWSGLPKERQQGLRCEDPTPGQTMQGRTRPLKRAGAAMNTAVGAA